MRAINTTADIGMGIGGGSTMTIGGIAIAEIVTGSVTATIVTMIVTMIIGVSVVISKS